MGVESPNNDNEGNDDDDDDGDGDDDGDDDDNDGDDYVLCIIAAYPSIIKEKFFFLVVFVLGVGFLIHPAYAANFLFFLIVFINNFFLNNSSLSAFRHFDSHFVNSSIGS